MTPEEIQAALATPFDASEVKYKPIMVKDNRALAIAYISARAVQDRLDEVLGIANWQDEYTTLPDGSMLCRLSVRIGEEWVTKMDVGSPSEQPDEGDRVKAAVSDALKRAAVKVGVGRYLYRGKPQWVDYDPKTKQILSNLVPASNPQTPRPVGNGPARQSPDVKNWKTWLETFPGREQVNKKIKELASLQEQDRPTVWNMVFGYCKQYGWPWDKDQKMFLEGQEAPV